MLGIKQIDFINLYDFFRPGILLLFSAKLIRLFVQLNSTGPSLEFRRDGTSPISWTTKTVFEELDFTSKLEVDGYETNELSVLPQLLIMAQEFLKSNSGRPDLWIGKLHGWWSIRARFLHQKLLDGRSVTLAGYIGSAASVIQTQMESFEGDRDLKTLWLCEQSDIHLYYYDVVSARSCLAEAGKTCKSEFNTIGI